MTGPTVVDITLVARLSGTVRDAGGVAISGAVVYAYQGGTGVVCCSYAGSGVSDGTGNYSFGLPAGTYKLFISPPAPNSSQWNGGGDFGSTPAVTVSGPTTVDITLHS